MKNVINWFQLPSFDFTRAITFYSNIFITSFKIEVQPNGTQIAYFPVEEGGVTGAIVPPSDNYRPANPHEGVRIFLSCEDKLDVILGRVEQSGGKIIEQKSPVNENNFIALIEDTEGNIIGLHGTQ